MMWKILMENTSGMRRWPYFPGLRRSGYLNVEKTHKNGHFLLLAGDPLDLVQFRHQIRNPGRKAP
jgi:hypothetical protein